jgi:hypothetical protein
MSVVDAKDISPLYSHVSPAAADRAQESNVQGTRISQGGRTGRVDILLLEGARGVGFLVVRHVWIRRSVSR